jgi:hypothetical protein
MINQKIPEKVVDQCKYFRFLLYLEIIFAGCSAYGFSTHALTEQLQVLFNVPYLYFYKYLRRFLKLLLCIFYFILCNHLCTFAVFIWCHLTIYLSLCLRLRGWRT